MAKIHPRFQAVGFEGIFQEIILDAIEEVGLANAIIEGRNSDFVPEETIFSILDNEES